jgi:hypothetical protein
MRMTDALTHAQIEHLQGKLPRPLRGESGSSTVKVVLN